MRNLLLLLRTLSGALEQVFPDALPDTTNDSCGYQQGLNLCHYLSLQFNSHFPGGPGLAGTRMSLFLDFIGAMGDGGGGNNWSYKMCKAPVKMSASANQHPMFYRPDALPVAQPTVPRH